MWEKTAIIFLFVLSFLDGQEKEHRFNVRSLAHRDREEDQDGNSGWKTKKGHEIEIEESQQTPIRPCPDQRGKVINVQILEKVRKKDRGKKLKTNMTMEEYARSEMMREGYESSKDSNITAEINNSGLSGVLLTPDVVPDLIKRRKAVQKENAQPSDYEKIAKTKDGRANIFFRNSVSQQRCPKEHRLNNKKRRTLRMDSEVATRREQCKDKFQKLQMSTHTSKEKDARALREVNEGDEISKCKDQDQGLSNNEAARGKEYQQEIRVIVKASRRRDKPEDITVYVDRQNLKRKKMKPLVESSLINMKGIRTRKDPGRLTSAMKGGTRRKPKVMKQEKRKHQRNNNATGKPEERSE